MMKFANLGYYFQRGYFRDFTSEMLVENFTGTENYFKERNKEFIDSSKIVVKSDDSLTGIVNTNIKLKTIYPGLVTGIGMIHETGSKGESKLGMAFDYTSGLPVIPGSSVKGLLRSMFPFLPLNKKKNDLDECELILLEEKQQFILEQLKSNNGNLSSMKVSDVEELGMMIFEGQNKDQSYLPIYERDIFFDVQIEGDYTQKGFLGLDFITPHKNELQDPNPIQFLKIMPKVTFVFRFRLNESKLSSGLTISIDDKKALFKTILETVGIGAKTNVGYGQLKAIK